jgi:3-oxoacyl-[acyl-carrier-protein] synthase III
MTGSKITGLGVALPQTEMTSAQLATRLGSTEEWIAARTGIRSRRIASANETTDHLGRAASRLAISDARLQPRDIDLVICATITAERHFPATACLIQSALGTKVPAFDIGAGCSGFLYALQLADSAIRAGNSRRILVVGTEVLSRITDYDDPKTSVLFGDGAGAAIVEESKGEPGLGRFNLFSDGTEPHLLHTDQHTGLIHMDGHRVYRAAVDGMATSVAGLLSEQGIGIADVDLVVAHQANQRILDAVASRLGLDPTIVYSNIARYGNTSAASIPIALYQARREGRLEEGSLVVLTAFGAGFTWGAGLLRWGTGNDRDRVSITTGVLDV